MSIDTVRRTARHALASRRDLAHELRLLRHEKAADTEYVRKVEARCNALNAELDKLNEALIIAGNELADLRQQAADANAAVARLGGENVALRSRVANLDPYRDLPEHRTGIGPLTRIEPLYHSPLAAVIDPGQVTDDTTVEIPVLRLPAAS